MNAPEKPRDLPPMSVAVVQKTPSHIPKQPIEIARYATMRDCSVPFTASKANNAPRPMPIITMLRRPRTVPNHLQAVSVLSPPIAMPAPIAKKM